MINKITKNIATGEITQQTVADIDKSFDQIKSEKLNELKSAWLNARNQGMPFTEQGQTYHFQTRPNSEDRNNWTELAEHAQMVLDDNSVQLPMRTAEDVTFMYTPLEVVSNVANIRLFVGACIQARWQVEEVINNETNKATLEAYNVQEAFQTAVTAIISQA